MNFPETFKAASATILEKELVKIRQASLIATRKGNFREVAELTIRAAKINDKIKAGMFFS